MKCLFYKNILMFGKVLYTIKKPVLCYARIKEIVSAFIIFVFLERRQKDCPVDENRIFDIPFFSPLIEVKKPVK